MTSSRAQELFSPYAAMYNFSHLSTESKYVPFIDHVAMQCVVQKTEDFEVAFFKKTDKQKQKQNKNLKTQATCDIPRFSKLAH